MLYYDVTKINFSDLRNQKRELLKVINERNLDEDVLDGILHLIDSIQEFVCDNLGYAEKDVFDLDDLDNQPEPQNKLVVTEGEEFARAMSEHIFKIHTYSTHLYLYNHKEMSEEFVETILNDPANVQTCIERIRTAILNDYNNNPNQFQRDPDTNKLCYDIDMFKYGYDIEAYCLEKFYEGKTKTMYLCKHCQSDNVEIKKWVNPNTGVVGADCEDPIGYCNDEDSHAVVYCADLKFLAKVVGFQVVDDGVCEYEIHPKMDGSFCIYNLSQANEMLVEDKGKSDAQWRLLTIWEGDIEEPTMMFEGDPRN